jgi:hypothetical protein
MCQHLANHKDATSKSTAVTMQLKQFSSWLYSNLTVRGLIGVNDLEGSSRTFSAVLYVFIDHKGRRKAKRVGSEKAALKVQEQV